MLNKMKQSRDMLANYI